MSDQTKSDRDVKSAADQPVPGSHPHFHQPPAGAPAHTDREVQPGTEHRVDSSHVAELASAIRAAGTPIPTAGNSSPGNDPAPFQQPKELLLQVGQLSEHMQQRHIELEHRAQLLNEQTASFEEQLRNHRLFVRQFEEEMHQRESNQRARENDLSQKIADCERLVGELEEQECLLITSREQLATSRAGLRAELDRELEIQRAALRKSQTVLEAEMQQLEEERTHHRQEHEETMTQGRQTLEVERAHLRQQMAIDLDAERAEFEQQQQQWITSRDEQIAEIQHEREISAAAVERAQRELQSLRDAQKQEIEQQKQQLEEEIAEERRRFEDEQIEQCQQWTAQRDTDRQEIEQERELNRQAIERAQAELEDQRVRQIEEIDQHTEQQKQQLDDQQQKISQEQGVFENRIRFQQEHLQKARLEIESAQNELRQEQQHTWLATEQRETVMRLQWGQLERYRTLLESREASVQREQELLTRARSAFENETKSDRNRMETEREAWEQERQAQRSEIRRQQDMLTLHAENLEARRTRLDALRAELEETHRNTLEMRMSVEEAWAQLTHSAGAEAAQARVDESREALSEHYQQLREALTAQREETTETEALFQRQKDEFRDERQKLTEWVANRDEKLRVFEQRLRNEGESLETREAAWRKARDNWMVERLEAEHVIRDLLRQLSDQNTTERADDAGPIVEPQPISPTELSSPSESGESMPDDDNDLASE